MWNNRGTDHLLRLAATSAFHVIHTFYSIDPFFTIAVFYSHITGGLDDLIGYGVGNECHAVVASKTSNNGAQERWRIVSWQMTPVRIEFTVSRQNSVSSIVYAISECAFLTYYLGSWIKVASALRFWKCCRILGRWTRKMISSVIISIMIVKV
jgi:hypothetical protein